MTGANYSVGVKLLVGVSSTIGVNLWVGVNVNACGIRRCDPFQAGFPGFLDFVGSHLCVNPTAGANNGGDAKLLVGANLTIGVNPWCVVNLWVGVNVNACGIRRCEPFRAGFPGFLGVVG